MWKKYKTIIIISGILVLVVIGGIAENLQSAAPSSGTDNANQSTQNQGWTQVVSLTQTTDGPADIGCLTAPFAVTSASWKIDWVITNHASPSAFLPDGIASELDLFPTDKTTGQVDGQNVIAILTPLPSPYVMYGASESGTYEGSGSGIYVLRVSSGNCESNSFTIDATVYQK